MLENKHSTSTKQRMTVSTFAKKTSAFLVHSSCPLKKPSLVAAFRIVKHLMFTIASWGFKRCSKLNVDGFLDVIRRTSLHFYLDGSILSQHEHQAYKWVQIIWWYVFNIHNLVMLHVRPHLGSVGSQTGSFPCWHPQAAFAHRNLGMIHHGRCQPLEMDIRLQFNHEFPMVSSNFGASNVPRKLEIGEKICNLSGTTSSGFNFNIQLFPAELPWCWGLGVRQRKPFKGSS